VKKIAILALVAVVVAVAAYLGWGKAKEVVVSRTWDRISKRPFDEVDNSSETRALLQQSMFFTPLPFVERVIFVATPHRGAIQAVAASGDEGLAAALRRPPTAIDNMNPRNPGLRLLTSMPVAPRISAHSIIAVKGDGPKEEGDDGEVAYKSAHIDGVASELVVRWDHSCQGQPEVIEEIRRILLVHAGVLGAPRS